MTDHRPARHRWVASLAAAVLAVTGLALVTAQPASAGVSETNYGFQTLGYGTRGVSDSVGLRSARTAYSYILCTRLAGKEDQESIAEANLPATDPQVHVEGVRSTSSTFKTSSGDKGTRSVNNIAKVVLGPADSPHIVITSLRTESKVWADRSGTFHTENTVTSGDIGGQTGTPLDEVLGQVGAGVRDIIAEIQANGGSYEIPGLGTLHLGATDTTKRDRWARARATIFRLDLSSADTVITIGRSYARINRDLPAGVMHGAGYGADVPAVLGGVLKVGRLGTKVLPCEGTRGETRSDSIAGLNLGNADALVLGALTGRVNGVQEKSGYARAWTEGEAASVRLGPIVITGIKGHAQVTQTKAGRIHKTIRGSTIGSLSTDGGQTTQAIPDPGQAIEVPGVAKLTFFVKEKTKRSLFVTAVRIELLPGSSAGPAGTVVRVGNARAAIQRY
jgi:hypothetical protein